MTKETKHGGARPGSGRKPLPKDKRASVTLALRMLPEQLELLTELAQEDGYRYASTWAQDLIMASRPQTRKYIKRKVGT